MQSFTFGFSSRNSRLAFMRPTTLGLLLAGVLWLILARAEGAQAAGVVGNGTAGSCTSFALESAMAGGGAVTFNCPAPYTIVITSPGGLLALGNVAVDGANGGNRMTLSGGGSTRIFYSTGPAVTLRNLILRDGNATSQPGAYPDQGGAILVNGGVLLLDNVIVRDSQATLAAGAIEVAAGAVSVNNSLIENNSSDYGGGIDSIGALTITSTIVRSNHATGHQGGGLDVGGPTLVLNSQIYSNTADGFGHLGGGIANDFLLTLTNSIVSGNSAADGGGIDNAQGTATLNGSTLSGNWASAANGGGIYNNQGSVMLNNTIVSGNWTNASSGGGIYNNGPMTLTASTLSANSSTYGGGIFNQIIGTITLIGSAVNGNSAPITPGGPGTGGGMFNVGVATLISSTLSGNSADSGGGIFNGSSGRAQLTNVTLSGNSAATGGGIYNGSTARAQLTNVTLSGNSAGDRGGGIYNSYVVSLWNVTLSNNTAPSGGSLFMNSGHTTYLTNTILAYSPAGGNCGGTVSASKYSISSDNSCNLAGWLEHPNPNKLDPLLTALGNYGGPTLVHMLKPNSPAIDGVVLNDAPLVDQRGLPRPGPDGSFDIGAVEWQAGESILAPRLYLPVVRR